MELFVINRHDDEKPQVTEEEESAKLERIFRKIERKKQHRIRQREREKQAKKVKLSSEKPINTQNEIIPNGVDNAANEDAVGASSAIAAVVEKQKDPETPHFTVLGSDLSFKKPKAQRVLPQWLAKPSVFSSNLQDLQYKVSKMVQLDKSIRKRLKANGIRYFFPIQAAVIPWLLDAHRHVDVVFPRDICVSAPTGSGKTLAFVLPVIQSLKRHTVRKIRTLVILPTQDLAEQIYKNFRLYAQGTEIEVGLISGKHDFNMEQKQLRYMSEAFGYVSKIDVLVCTAGRLVAHLKSTEGFNLHSLEFLVIDEADRVLEAVQDDWLYHLEKHILKDDYSVQSRKVLNLLSLDRQRPPQKMLFSATLSQDPEKLEKLSLFQPKLFTCTSDSQTGALETNETDTVVGKYTTPQELTEKYIECVKELKPLVLYQFIKKSNLTKTIVFTHSIQSTHRLKILLDSLFNSNLKIEEISSSLNGKKRDTMIANFAAGNIDVLICTDALARGINLPGVQCVISYTAPKYLKTYIHRVGRTARAGEPGLAVTLLEDDQKPLFRSMLETLKKTNMEKIAISEEDLEMLGKLYKKSLHKLKQVVHKEEKDQKLNTLSKKKSFKVRLERTKKNAEG